MQRLRLDQISSYDPLVLLSEVTQNGVSQDVCINDLGIYFYCTFFLISGHLHIKKCCFCFAEPPAFEVLPSLKRLKKRVLAASRGQYDAVFMSGR